MIRFHGRIVDPGALWSEYVNFPPNFDANNGDEFSPLVQCPNPEHQTEKRHFQVNLKKDLVHCFANCGISGTYENAISMIEGVTQREARKTILKHSRVGNLDLQAKGRRSRDKEPETVLDNSYETYLPPVGLEYLQSRGISSESISKWEIGWDSKSLRIVIPAKDAQGRVKFLIRRAVKERDHPKYLYPKDSDRNKMLFGSCFIDAGMVRSSGLVLVEGSIDEIVFHQYGIANTGAILGSYLSEIQAKRIMNMRPPVIFTFFDADGAGIDATFSVKKRLPQIPIRVCRYPRGKTDPAELTREEAVRAIDRSITFSSFSRRINSRSPRIKKELKYVG